MSYKTKKIKIFIQIGNIENPNITQRKQKMEA